MEDGDVSRQRNSGNWGTSAWPLSTEWLANDPRRMFVHMRFEEIWGISSTISVSRLQIHMHLFGHCLETDPKRLRSPTLVMPLLLPCSCRSGMFIFLGWKLRARGWFESAEQGHDRLMDIINDNFPVAWVWVTYLSSWPRNLSLNLHKLSARTLSRTLLAENITQWCV